jgi:hypothetical protein
MRLPFGSTWPTEIYFLLIVPGAMESQVFCNPAQISEVFQIAIHSLVAHNGQQLAGVLNNWMIRVFINIHLHFFKLQRMITSNQDVQFMNKLDSH